MRMQSNTGIGPDSPPLVRWPVNNEDGQRRRIGASIYDFTVSSGHSSYIVSPKCELKKQAATQQSEADEVVNDIVDLAQEIVRLKSVNLPIELLRQVASQLDDVAWQLQRQSFTSQTYKTWMERIKQEEDAGTVEPMFDENGKFIEPWACDHCYAVTTDSTNPS